MISCFAWLLLAGGCALTPPEHETPIAQVVAVRHVGADALAAELVKQSGIQGGDAVTVTVDPRTNSLILTCAPGHSEELAALRKRVAELDDNSRAGWTGVGSICGRPLFTQMVFLREASATEVAQEAGGFRPGVWIEADPRTNSLVVSSTSEEDLGETLVEIGRLDRAELPQY